jgi:hypothetical protein
VASFVVLLAGYLLLAGSAAAASGPFVTGFTNDFASAGTAAQELPRVRNLGGKVVQLPLNWNDVAPNRPAGDPANPASYNWGGFDVQVKRIVDAGLEPTVLIVNTPKWAGGGSVIDAPNPQAYGDFAQAAATRYSGYISGIPRVRSWQAWNEPNAGFFFSPLSQSPALYREMLREFADGVYKARSDDLVVAGNTFPNILDNGSTAIPPLRFMREVLCCGAPLRFDVWGHHPYTSGGPNHKASRSNADNVALGDLKNMRKLLDQARSNGRVQTNTGGRIRLWITEFSWDSSPPDSKSNAPTSKELKRWIPEAMYNSYAAGADLFVWFQMRDDTRSEGQYQSGLYYANNTIKPYASSFRFPFLARPNKRKRGRPATALVWGRTPNSKKTKLIVQQRVRGSWRKLKKLKANGYGVFLASKVTLKGSGALRAKLTSGAVSPSYAPKANKDRFVKPFGD